MATLSDLIVYNDEINESAIETIAQQLNVVNEATRGTIQMVMQGFEGDYKKNAFYQSFNDVYDIDMYATNNARAASNLAQIEKIGVKAAGGIKKKYEPKAMSWVGKSVDEGIEVASRGIANATTQYVINNAIGALVAALENNVNVTKDVSGDPALVSQVTLNQSHALFGDHSGDLICQIMHSSTYHRLIDQSLLNNAQLYTAGNVRILDILGKIIVVTDAPALYEAGTPNKEKVVSLREGGLVISGMGDSLTTIDRDTTKDRSEIVVMNEFSYGLSVDGYAWDTTNGGKSPLSSEIATGTNWDKYSTSDKHTAGVIAIGSADVVPS